MTTAKGPPSHDLHQSKRRELSSILVAKGVVFFWSPTWIATCLAILERADNVAPLLTDTEIVTDTETTLLPC